jgi:2-isopropylmalate synthase
MSARNIVIFDTTLRDGEQSPGASMTADEKLRIAQSLERLGVDVIEAGFAAASPGDFAAIERIAKTVRKSSICSLSRALDKDIERAGEAIQAAAHPRIHTFIATSPIHMQHKLRMQPDQVVEQAIAAIKKARSLVADVEFSCEDAGRSDIDFLCRIVEQAIKAGARTINIPDTVGYAIPEEFGERIRTLIERIPNSDQAIFSVHCHNDLGLAVANSLAAIKAGAGQVECTINGLGERAGNASLEEIVMAMRTRKDFMKVECNIDTTQIVPASKLVSSITGFQVQRNKAIVGANAFAHESGIHQDGMLKNRETYEIMRAEDVGWTTNRLTLGKLSGRNAFNSRLTEMGVQLEAEDLNEAFIRFKTLADKKSEIFDEDLMALINDSMAAANTYTFESLESHSIPGQKPHAVIHVTVEGCESTGEADGSGPVDAAFKAIESVVESGAHLLLYSVNAVTEGTDSQGEVSVRLEHGGHIVNGTGADTDIVIASAKAYINALNLLSSIRDRRHPQAS